MGGPLWVERLQRHGALLLCVVVTLLYLPSLAGDFLPYDDDWLIVNNPLLDAPLGEALSALFLDFSLETRLTLGAEYLPLRDLSHYVEVALFGKRPFGMRIGQLGLYLAALLLLRSVFQRCLAPTLAWVALVCFAVHPTHVESVAWLAGRKDVLALFFVCAALACYVREGNSRWCAVPLVAAATLSKSMSVVCPGLLLAMDLLARRRPAWKVLFGCLAGVGLVFAVQLLVGSTVGMVGGPLSGSRVAAFWTMGEVWLRYLKALVYPSSLSIVYDASPVAVATFASVIGWLLMAGSVGYGVWRALGGKTLALGVAVWAWLPLLPVSQVLFPLQNVQADRYLWLTSVALGLVLGAAWRVNRAGKGPTAALLALFALGTAHRAALFGDPVALFADASGKSTGPRAPYQLGYALQQQGETVAAIEAYEAALERPCDDCSPQSSAANNLATLFVAQNEAHLAEPVLRRNLARFPDEPKSLFNLVKVLTRLGRVEEARKLYDEGKLRFPDYNPSAGPQPIGGR